MIGNSRYIFYTALSISLLTVSCKSRNGNTSTAKADQNGYNDQNHAYSTILVHVGAESKTAIAKAKFSLANQSVLNQRKMVFSVATEVQGQFNGLSTKLDKIHVVENDVFGLVNSQTPNFYAMVTPEYGQLFELLGMDTPDTCNPTRLRQVISPEEYLTRAETYDEISEPQKILDGMDKTVDRIIFRINNLIRSYKETYTALPTADSSFSGKSPTEKFSLLEKQIISFLKNRNPTKLDVSEEGKRAAIYQTALKVHSALQKFGQINSSGSNQSQSLATRNEQLFRILGRELPAVCDASKTPYINVLTPEEYLMSRGTYNNIGASDKAFTDMLYGTTGQLTAIRVELQTADSKNTYDKGATK